jgi:hypothetical protein
MVGIAVENQIVMLPTFGEILIGVVNHLICGKGADHFHIPRDGYPSHIRAERLGYLNSEGTHTSACTVERGKVIDLRPDLSRESMSQWLRPIVEWRLSAAIRQPLRPVTASSFDERGCPGGEWNIGATCKRELRKAAT